MKSNLPTVTVCISAYNEEQNINAFISSVLRQNQKNYILKKILILSDGSTDNTQKIVKKFHSTLIDFRHFESRTGKSTRLNQIYEIVTTDYIIQSDADVTFADTKVIEHIVAEFEKNKKIVMCAGLPIPLPAQTFTEHAENESYKIYCKVNKKINNGTIGFTADGRILAYRSSFAKTLHIPSDMIANDLYTYMVVQHKKLGYKFVEQAIVYFRSPSTINDKIRQCIRFTAASQRMLNYFPRDLVLKENTLPIYLNIKSKALQLAYCPIEGLYMYILYKYCAWIAYFREHTLTAKWDMATTTKRLQTAL